MDVCFLVLYWRIIAAGHATNKYNLIFTDVMFGETYLIFDRQYKLNRKNI